MKKTEQEVREPREICIQYDSNGNCLTRPTNIMMGAESVQFIEKSYADQLEFSFKLLQNDYDQLAKELEQVRGELGRLKEYYGDRDFAEQRVELILEKMHLKAELQAEIDYKHRLNIAIDKLKAELQAEREHFEALKASLIEAVEMIEGITETHSAFCDYYDTNICSCDKVKCDEAITKIKSKHPDIWGEN